jgi:hypothetical protein
MPTHPPAPLTNSWKLAPRVDGQRRRLSAAFSGLVFAVCGCQPPIDDVLPVDGAPATSTEGATTTTPPPSGLVTGSSTTDASNTQGVESVGSDGPVSAVPSAEGSSGTTGAPTTEEAAFDCEALPAPRAPLRRLTRFEYHNTVRDLFGVTSNAMEVLPGEEAGSGFGNDADALSASRILIDGYLAVARQVSQQATTDAAAVERVTGCSPAQGEAECKQSFLDSYLSRAFRRPVDASELTSYAAMFDQGQMLGGDFASGVRAVIERSLQAPQFLYKVEVGESVDPARALGRPTGYEMATRLSYLLWSSAPDAELLDAAKQGLLDTKEGVREQAERMLGNEKAKASLRYFHAQLFGTGGLDYLERDAEYHPTFRSGMGKLFREETEHFLDYVIFEGGGDLATVFTAPYTFVNGPLAEFYGIAGVTHASILTLTTPGNRTDPVVRGKWLLTKTLCGVVPDPPKDVPLLPEPEPGQPVRERLARHQADPACRDCHTLMDPLGLPFENFDGVGLWRDTDNGAPIDVSGAVPVGDVAGPFAGALEFADKVGQSQDVRECYVGRYMTYAYGRTISANDACSQAGAKAAFEQAQGNIKALALAITQTDGFLFRAMVAPGQ